MPGVPRCLLKQVHEDPPKVDRCLTGGTPAWLIQAHRRRNRVHARPGSAVAG
jgi:hypothetical protein